MSLDLLGGARESFSASVIYYLKRLLAAPNSLTRLCFKTNQSFRGSAGNYNIICK
jgi:hypothetical protein